MTKGYLYDKTPNEQEQYLNGIIKNLNNGQIKIQGKDKVGENIKSFTTDTHGDLVSVMGAQVTCGVKFMENKFLYYDKEKGIYYEKVINEGETIYYEYTPPYKGEENRKEQIDEDTINKDNLMVVPIPDTSNARELYHLGDILDRGKESLTSLLLCEVSDNMKLTIGNHEFDTGTNLLNGGYQKEFSSINRALARMKHNNRISMGYWDGSGDNVRSYSHTNTAKSDIVMFFEFMNSVYRTSKYSNKTPLIIEYLDKEFENIGHKDLAIKIKAFLNTYYDDMEESFEEFHKHFTIEEMLLIKNAISGALLERQIGVGKNNEITCIDGYDGFQDFKELNPSGENIFNFGRHKQNQTICPAIKGHDAYCDLKEIEGKKCYNGKIVLEDKKVLCIDDKKSAGYREDKETAITVTNFNTETGEVTNSNYTVERTEDGIEDTFTKNIKGYEKLTLENFVLKKTAEKDPRDDVYDTIKNIETNTEEKFNKCETEKEKIFILNILLSSCSNIEQTKKFFESETVKNFIKDNKDLKNNLIKSAFLNQKICNSIANNDFSLLNSICGGDFRKYCNSDFEVKYKNMGNEFEEENNIYLLNCLLSNPNIIKNILNEDYSILDAVCGGDFKKYFMESGFFGDYDYEKEPVKDLVVNAVLSKLNNLEEIKKFSKMDIFISAINNTKIQTELVEKILLRPDIFEEILKERNDNSLKEIFGENYKNNFKEINKDFYISFNNENLMNFLLDNDLLKDEDYSDLLITVIKFDNKKIIKKFFDKFKDNEKEFPNMFTNSILFTKFLKTILDSNNEEIKEMFLNSKEFMKSITNNIIKKNEKFIEMFCLYFKENTTEEDIEFLTSFFKNLIKNNVEEKDIIELREGEIENKKTVYEFLSDNYIKTKHCGNYNIILQVIDKLYKDYNIKIKNSKGNEFKTIKDLIKADVGDKKISRYEFEKIIGEALNNCINRISEITIKYLTKEEVIKKITKKTTKKDVENFIKLFNKNEVLTKEERKDILKYIVENKGPNYFIELYHGYDKQWDLNEKDIDDLFFNAFSNNGKNSYTLIEKLFKTFPEIDINKTINGTNLFNLACKNKSEYNLEIMKKLFEKNPNYKDKKTLIEKSLESKNSNIAQFLIRHSTLNDLKSVKYKIALLQMVIANNDVETFKKISTNIYTSITNENKYILIETAINSKDTKIIDYIISEGWLNKVNKQNLENLLNNSLKSDNLNVEIFNKIVSEIPDLKINFPDNPIKDINKEIQGKDQIGKIKRDIKCNGNKIETVTDTAFTNLKSGESRRLYEVVYDNKGNKTITYYNKKGDILAKANINENNELTFDKSTNCTQEEINEIINDDYLNMDGFDYNLSYLSYAPLQNKENVIFKTNCEDINSIVDIINESNKVKDKTFICDFAIDDHNVQILVNDGSVTLLNTGLEFDYIRDEIEQKCEEKKLENVNIKHVETVQQAVGNCVEASKLYTIALAMEYENKFKTLDGLSERLNRFEKLMKNTLSKETEDKQVNFLKDNYNKGDKEILTILLEAHEKLLKNKKHFEKLNENFEKFQKLIEDKKIEPKAVVTDTGDKKENNIKVNDNKIKPKIKSTDENKNKEVNDKLNKFLSKKLKRVNKTKEKKNNPKKESEPIKLDPNDEIEKVSFEIKEKDLSDVIIEHRIKNLNDLKNILNLDVCIIDSSYINIFKALIYFSKDNNEEYTECLKLFEDNYNILFNKKLINNSLNKLTKEIGLENSDLEKKDIQLIEKLEIIKKEIENIKEKAEKGDLDTIKKYIKILENNIIPTSKNEKIKYYKLIADKGDSKDKKEYADMLYNGNKVEINKEEALRYYGIAADKNDAAAKKAAEMYENGEGVEKDKEGALHYYNKISNKDKEIESKIKTLEREIEEEKNKNKTTKKYLTKDEIFKKIKNYKYKDKDKCIQLFGDNKDSLTEEERKDIIKGVFKEQNILFEDLYKSYDNWNLNKEDIKELFDHCSSYIPLFDDNKDQKEIGYSRAKKLFEIFPDTDIDTKIGRETLLTLACEFDFNEIRELFKKYPDIYKNKNYTKGKTPIDIVFENRDKNSSEEKNPTIINNFNRMVDFLIEHTTVNDLKLVSQGNKLKLLERLIHLNNTELFKIIYDDLERSGNINIKNTPNLIYQAFDKGNIEIFKHIKVDKFDNFNLIYIKENLKKSKNFNVKLFNEIANSNKDITIDNIMNTKEKQGKDQIGKIKRDIKCNGNKIETVTDTAFTNLKSGKNRKLYEVVYDNKGNKTITYYNKKGDILAKANINENNELTFDKSISCTQEEINEILNDDYVSMDAFDENLSYLSYAPLQNKENIIFKTSCEDINSIVDIINNSQDEKNKNKTFICDFGIDGHDVQILVNDGSVTLLNTGLEFDYIRDEIEQKCEEKKLKNVNIKHIKNMQQVVGNCVEASKLYTITLVMEYENKFKTLDGLSERLNRFEKLIEDTLSKKTEDEQVDLLKDNYNKEDAKILIILLKVHKKLLKNKLHFENVDDRLEKFKKLIEVKRIKPRIVTIDTNNKNKKEENKKKTKTNAVEDIIKLMKNVDTIDDRDHFIELFKENKSLTREDRIKILEYAFENTILSFLEPLYNSYSNWELTENEIEELFNCTIKNKKHPEFAYEFLFEKYPDISKKIIEKQGIEGFIEKAMSNENYRFVRYLFKKSDNKEKLLQINDISLFILIPICDDKFINEYYNIILNNFKKRKKEINKFLIENNIKKWNKIPDNLKKELISIRNFSINYLGDIYYYEKKELINNFNFNGINNNFLTNYIKSIEKSKDIKIESLNAIIAKKPDLEIKIDNPIKNIKTIGKQGIGQTKISERNIKYNENKIETVIDTVFTNLKEGKNRKLYEIIYRDNGTKTITYYNKKGKILAKANINKNNELTFDKSINCTQEEINEILNDDYVSMDAFDYNLSYLSYAPLKNKENVIFKTNCEDINSIVDIIENSIDNKNKTFICDLSVYNHNVQVLVNNGNINILNTGLDFKYIRNEIEQKCKEKKLKNVNIKHIKTIQQTVGNCVEASKLYTVALAIEYEKKLKTFDRLSERLNRFEKLMKDTLSKETEDEQVNFLKDNYNKEDAKILIILLKMHKELLKNKLHFRNVDNRLEKFKKLIEVKRIKPRIVTIDTNNKKVSIDINTDITPSIEPKATTFNSFDEFIYKQLEDKKDEAAVKEDDYDPKIKEQKIIHKYDELCIDKTLEEAKKKLFKDPEKIPDDFKEICDKYFKVFLINNPDTDRVVRKLYDFYYLYEQSIKFKENRVENKSNGANPVGYSKDGTVNTNNFKDTTVSAISTDLHGSMNATLFFLLDSGVAKFKKDEPTFVYYDMVSRKAYNSIDDFLAENKGANIKDAGFLKLIPNLKINEKYNGKAVNCGDLIDAGSYSDEVVATFSYLEEQEKNIDPNNKKIIRICGNHEITIKNNKTDENSLNWKNREFTYRDILEDRVKLYYADGGVLYSHTLPNPNDLNNGIKYIEIFRQKCLDENFKKCSKNHFEELFKDFNDDEFNKLKGEIENICNKKQKTLSTECTNLLPKYFNPLLKIHCIKMITTDLAERFKITVDKNNTKVINEALSKYKNCSTLNFDEIEGKIRLYAENIIQPFGSRVGLSGNRTLNNPICNCVFGHSPIRGEGSYKPIYKNEDKITGPDNKEHVWIVTALDVDNGQTEGKYLEGEKAKTNAFYIKFEEEGENRKPKAVACTMDIDKDFKKLKEDNVKDLKSKVIINQFFIKGFFKDDIKPIFDQTEAQKEQEVRLARIRDGKVKDDMTPVKPEVMNKKENSKAEIKKEPIKKEEFNKIKEFFENKDNNLANIQDKSNSLNKTILTYQKLLKEELGEDIAKIFPIDEIQTFISDNNNILIKALEAEIKNKLDKKQYEEFLRQDYSDSVNTIKPNTPALRNKIEAYDRLIPKIIGQVENLINSSKNYNSIEELFNEAIVITTEKIKKENEKKEYKNNHITLIANEETILKNARKENPGKNDIESIKLYLNNSGNNNVYLKIYDTDKDKKQKTKTNIKLQCYLTAIKLGDLESINKYVEELKNFVDSLEKSSYKQFGKTKEEFIENHLEIIKKHCKLMASNEEYTNKVVDRFEELEKSLNTNAKNNINNITIINELDKIQNIFSNSVEEFNKLKEKNELKKENKLSIFKLCSKYSESVKNSVSKEIYDMFGLFYTVQGDFEKIVEEEIKLDFGPEEFKVYNGEKDASQTIVQTIGTVTSYREYVVAESYIKLINKIFDKAKEKVKNNEYEDIKEALIVATKIVEEELKEKNKTLTKKEEKEILEKRVIVLTDIIKNNLKDSPNLSENYKKAIEVNVERLKELEKVKNKNKDLIEKKKSKKSFIPKISPVIDNKIENKDRKEELNNNKENNEKVFTFTTNNMYGEIELKIVKNLKELNDIIDNITFINKAKDSHGYYKINNKNIETLNNALIDFIKNNKQEELKKFLKIFKERMEAFNISYSTKEVINYCNNNLKKLAEEAEIDDFNIDVINDSIDDLYNKLGQVAGIKVEKEVDSRKIEIEDEKNHDMTEKNNPNTKNQSKNGIISEIKKQTAGIKIKTEDIDDLTIKLKEWNDCVLNKKEPKDELKEIKIDDFVFTYDEFKNLVDNKLLTQDYYKDLKDKDDKEELEVNLDKLMPSMSKDGIFNMMMFNLAKHSSISDKVELHYLNAEETNKEFHPIIQVMKKLDSNKILIDNIIEESKKDGKVHFILGDIASKEAGIEISGHVTPYIVVNGEIFEFDSVASYNVFLENSNGYSTKYIQQSDNTSCKTIAVREVDNFLKMLENFDSIEEFSRYLKQFFSENREEYYIDPDDLNGDLIEGAEKNARLAILPFPILKNSQSLSSLKKTLTFIQNLNKKYKSLEGEKKEEFIKKYKHILEMEDKLKKLIERFEIQKRINGVEEAKSVNAYTLKERLRQAKTLVILLEKGQTKSLENVKEYKNAKKGKAVLTTVNKKWIKEINNKSVENNKEEFTFTTFNYDTKTEKSEKVKDLDKLKDVIYDIQIVGCNKKTMDDNIKNLTNSLIYFIKKSDQNEFREFLKTFKDVMGDFDCTKYDNIFIELAEKEGIKDFNIDVINDSIDDLYNKLGQVAGIKTEKKEEDESLLIEEEEEDLALDETAQNLSNNLDELNNKEKSETLTIEEINSIETPMEAYDKIIAPALEGIKNIGDISISEIFTNISNKVLYESKTKILIQNELKKLFNKEENKQVKNRFKEVLSKDGVIDKLNSIGGKDFENLGDMFAQVIDIEINQSRNK